ncbi:MAG: hypothetical protein ISN28_15595 [Ectothiorhodospiraceae bacterium AqS1]|nr:hypothetical protein [Ectothiorhodospiraceae bacterium AqS1]MBF2761656.1 hypothetical protein [Ectothiorhodospiraceae bacterium AqS1]
MRVHYRVSPLSIGVWVVCKTKAERFIEIAGERFPGDVYRIEPVEIEHRIYRMRAVLYVGEFPISMCAATFREAKRNLFEWYAFDPKEKYEMRDTQ